MSTPASGLAQIGKSVFIKGELSGSEDLYLDGQVEGSITLKGNSLTVGPNGQVKASVEAKGVVVHGRQRAGQRSRRIAQVRGRYGRYHHAAHLDRRRRLFEGQG